MRTGSGIHWFVICRPTHSCIEIFDSIGTTARYLSNLDIYNIGECEFNTTGVQPEFSDKCGEFCLFFIFMRYFNLDLNLSECLNDVFSEDREENEREVLNFLQTI